MHHKLVHATKTINHLVHGFSSTLLTLDSPDVLIDPVIHQERVCGSIVRDKSIPQPLVFYFKYLFDTKTTAVPHVIRLEHYLQLDVLNTN